jgi:PAS domain S-box-containing protein
VEASEQELRAQLGFARSLLASNPLPMAVLDGERRYLDVNPAWEQFTGQRREAVLGQPARNECSAEASALHAQMDAQLMAEGGERHYEAVWCNANGRQRDLFISKASFPGTDGRPGGIVVAFMDISEFREAERTTRAARDAALETSRAKSEFIANVSHELRTPLQSILGFSELGQARARAQPRFAEMFADVHNAGRRMLALVYDLLDLSKIEQAQEQLHPERQDLRPLLRELAAELQPLLADKQLGLSVRGGDQELVALVDAPRLQQVLRNLLANAIKFSPSGAAVELLAGVDGQRLRIDVLDRGPGIPPAELEQIFEAFVQSTATIAESPSIRVPLATTPEEVKSKHFIPYLNMK